MGLCKCRTVTTLFCFEHRKNVCERCVVSDHPQCVVRTYLQWLQDSDYDPSCTLCKQPLAGPTADGTAKPTIRLTCFDLFHWECLEREAIKKTAGGELSKAKCPICTVPLLPMMATDSPLITQIRQILANSTWNDQLAAILTNSNSANETLSNKANLLGGHRQADEANLHNSHPTTQPNGRGAMVAIEIGPRAQFMDPAVAFAPLRSGHAPPNRSNRTDDPKIHAPPHPSSSAAATAAATFGRPRRGTSSNALLDDDLLPTWSQRLRQTPRILLNCLTLRNVRMCNMGISPRRTLLALLLLLCLLLLTTRLLFPPLLISSATI